MKFVNVCLEPLRWELMSDRQGAMNKKAVVFGALAGLGFQLGTGSVMGILWIRGNVGTALSLLIIGALISAFVAALVAAIMSGCKEVTHGIASVLVLTLASTFNNILRGDFELVGFLIGVTLALAAGWLGARVAIFARHINSSKHHQLPK